MDKTITETNLDKIREYLASIETLECVYYKGGHIRLINNSKILDFLITPTPNVMQVAFISEGIGVRDMTINSELNPDGNTLKILYQFLTTPHTLNKKQASMINPDYEN